MGWHLGTGRLLRGMLGIPYSHRSLPYEGRDFLSKSCKCADCTESPGWERPWE